MSPSAMSFSSLTCRRTINALIQKCFGLVSLYHVAQLHQGHMLAEGLDVQDLAVMRVAGTSSRCISARLAVEALPLRTRSCQPAAAERDPHPTPQPVDRLNTSCRNRDIKSLWCANAGLSQRRSIAWN